MQISLLDQDLLQIALREDLGSPFFDVTTEIMFADRDFFSARANIVSKHPHDFILCGMALVPMLLKQFTAACEYNIYYQDKDRIAPGTVILSLQGSVKTLLMLERTLLNFLQHLSAIATNTQSYVAKIQHTSLKILDTRKTTPGFRHLDKYAVYCGGGINHRAGLYDAILIKDNHIDALGGVGEVIKRLPTKKSYETVIEIRTIDELHEVLKHGLHKIDRVLLDNMNLQQLKNCVDLCKGKIATEASGNIDLNSIVAIAETGVDFASIGKLTHSFANVDLSMQMCK